MSDFAKYDDIRGKEVHQLVKEQCSLGWRRCGTEIDRRAVDYILKKFREYGLEETRLEPYEFSNKQGVPQTWELTVLAGSFPPLPPTDRAIPCYPLIDSGSTGEDGVVADLACFTGLQSQRIEGRIALIDASNESIFFRNTSNLRSLPALALRKGAVGVIVGFDLPGNAIPYRRDVMSPYLAGRDNLPGGLGVGKFDMSYLKSLVMSDDHVRVKVLLKVKRETVKSQNVLGALPGETDEVILVGSHYDSTFTGAIDNASGVAGLLTLAKHYSRTPESKRRKKFVFAVFGGHECEGGCGSQFFARKHLKDIIPQAAFYLNMDHLAAKGYEEVDERLIETGMDEKRVLMVSNGNSLLHSFAKDAIIKHKLLPTSYTANIIAGDPNMIYQITKGEPPMTALFTQSVFYHTMYDTPDKMTPDQLERAVKAHVDMIDKVDEIPGEKIKAAGTSKLNLISYFYGRNTEHYI